MLMAGIIELTTRVMLMLVAEMVIVNRGYIRPMLRGGWRVVGGGREWWVQCQRQPAAGRFIRIAERARD